MESHIITNQIDLILFEEGRFMPVNWLLRVDRLDYDDYKNWKNGNADYLEDHFNAPIADLENERTPAASIPL